MSSKSGPVPRTFQVGQIRITPLLDGDLDAALDPDAPRVHAEARGNVILEGVMRTPGLDAAFARAAKIVELDMRGRRQSAMPMEPRGAVGLYDAARHRHELFVGSGGVASQVVVRAFGRSHT